MCRLTARTSWVRFQAWVFSGWGFHVLSVSMQIFIGVLQLLPTCMYRDLKLLNCPRVCISVSGCLPFFVFMWPRDDPAIFPLCHPCTVLWYATVKYAKTPADLTSNLLALARGSALQVVNERVTAPTGLKSEVGGRRQCVSEGKRSLRRWLFLRCTLRAVKANLTLQW